MVQRCSRVRRNACLSERGKCVTIEMARKILCFSKVIVMPTCKVLLSAMGKERRAHSGAKRLSVVEAQEDHTRLERYWSEKQKTEHQVQYVLCWQVETLFLKATNSYGRISSRVVT